MSVQHFIIGGYITALVGFLGLGLTIRYAFHHKQVASARHRAIVSALGDGVRVVVSLGVVGGYPYRVAVGGQVYGFVTISAVLDFIYELECGDSERVRESAIPVHHPSLSV